MRRVVRPANRAFAPSRDEFPVGRWRLHQKLPIRNRPGVELGPKRENLPTIALVRAEPDPFHSLIGSADMALFYLSAYPRNVIR